MQRSYKLEPIRQQRQPHRDWNSGGPATPLHKLLPRPPFVMPHILATTDFKIGDRIILRNQKAGCVRWIGHTRSRYHRTELSIGVALDDRDGDHDGLYQGVRYFRTTPGHAVIVKARFVAYVFNKVTLQYDMTSATRKWKDMEANRIRDRRAKKLEEQNHRMSHRTRSQTPPGVPAGESAATSPPQGGRSPNFGLRDLNPPLPDPIDEVLSPKDLDGKDKIIIERRQRMLAKLRQGFQAGRRLQELEAKMAEDKELADEYDRREAAGHAARYYKPTDV